MTDNVPGYSPKLEEPHMVLKYSDIINEISYCLTFDTDMHETHYRPTTTIRMIIR